MVVAFMGLTGPSGVLPQHYTALLMRRLRDKDTSLRDFLDLFNHRLVSLFYRAWEKYRLPFAYERSRLDQGSRGPEKIAQALYCLVGRGTGGLRGRQEIPEEVFLYYSGHFAAPSALGFSPGTVAARLFRLAPPRPAIPGTASSPGPRRPNTAPVTSATARPEQPVQGSMPSSATMSGTCRARFGCASAPLLMSSFVVFSPVSGDLLRPVSQLTRSYVGREFAFDVQLVLKANEVPRTRLGAKRDGGSRLGWNTWMRSRPCTRDVDDVVFSGVEE